MATQLPGAFIWFTLNKNNPARRLQPVISFFRFRKQKILQYWLPVSLLLSVFAFSTGQVKAASYVWTGNTSRDWTDPTNWNLNNGTYPGQSAGDNVSIPVTTNPPLLATTPANALASVTFTGITSSLTINSATLTISGDFVINSFTTTNVSDTLTGDGTVACNNFQIGSGTGATANRTTILIYTLANLNVSSDLVVNSSYSTRRNNARITHTSGVITVNGSVTTVNPNANNTSSYVMTNGGATLNLTSATPFSIDATGGNILTMSPASATVDYQSSSSFTLPTEITAYRNLTISGGGGNTKTLGVTTTISGLITVAANSTFDIGTTGSAFASTGLVLETVGGGNGASIIGTGSANIAGAGVTVNYTGTGAITTGASIAIDLVMTGNRNFTIANDGIAPAVDLTISGAISGTGTNNLVKLGDGQLMLTGSNSYTGTTIISAGAIICNADVQVSTNGPLGNAASAITLGNAATAANNSSPSLLLSGAVTIARPITIASNTTTGNYTIGTLTDNNVTISGAITYNRSFVVTQAATTGGNQLVFSGGMTGAAGVAKTINFDISGTTLVSAAIDAGTNVSSVIKQNSGTLILETANAYTGGTTLNAGTLVINNASALGDVGGTFTIAGGTIENTSGSPITTLDYPLEWSGDFVFDGPQDINFGSGAVILDANIQLTVNSTYTLTIGGTINSNTMNLAKEGNGTLSFVSQDISLHNLQINTGILVATSGTVGLTGDLTITGSFVHNNGTVDFNGTGAQSIPAADFYNLNISGDKSGADITLVNGGTIGLEGTFTVTATNAGYVVTGNSFEYKGASTQTVTAFTYNNLILSNNGIKTILAGTTVTAKTLTINNSASIELPDTASLNLN